MDLEAGQKSAAHTVADEEQARSDESVFKISNRSDRLHTSMDFKVKKNFSFGITFGVHALEASVERLDSALQKITFSSGNRKVTSPFKYAVLKRSTDFDLKTDGESSTFDFDGAPNEIEYFKKDLATAYV